MPSPTAATTLQFYGGEVWAVAQIGTTIYLGGSFTSVGGRGPASAVYIGGHLTNLCTVRNASYTVPCPGALTVRTHVAALDPATGVPLAWNPGASGTRGVLAIEALPAGLAIGGDFQGAAGATHRGFALFPGTP